MTNREPDAAKTILVTGSTSGIGLTTAQMLVELGHHVVVHARNQSRADEAKANLNSPIVVGDLASMDETVALAKVLRTFGRFDAVIHNAGIYEDNDRVETVDGLERTFQVNVVAPYLLTALTPLPSRLIYLTSGMGDNGEIALDDLQHERRQWSPTSAYRDSKLCDLAMAVAFARLYPGVSVTAVCPGWVQTRMGGSSAPTDPRTGSATQVWLAASDDPAAQRTGRYMRHMRELPIPPSAASTSIQDGLIAACTEITHVPPPAQPDQDKE